MISTHRQSFTIYIKKTLNLPERIGRALARESDLPDEAIYIILSSQ